GAQSFLLALEDWTLVRRAHGEQRPVVHEESLEPVFAGVETCLDVGEESFSELSARSCLIAPETHVEIVDQVDGAIGHRGGRDRRLRIDSHYDDARRLGRDLYHLLQLDPGFPHSNAVVLGALDD